MVSDCLAGELVVLVYLFLDYGESNNLSGLLWDVCRSDVGIVIRVIRALMCVLPSRGRVGAF